MDGFVDRGITSPTMDDPFSFSELLNFDGCAEVCSPSTLSQNSMSFALSTIHQPSPGIWSPFATASDGPGDGSVNGGGGYAACFQENMVLQRGSSKFGFLHDPPSMDSSRSSRANGLADSGNALSNATGLIPRSLNTPISLADKMLIALSFFKESFGSGFLAQVWMPVRLGDTFMLSTHDQPFLLDQALSGYREISRMFTFAAREAPGVSLGLPGRVFISRLPEWTSNVLYYSKEEYLRFSYALSHKVRGSLAVPVLDPTDQSCCAVLELITLKEKPDFDSEIESVCRSLQSVNLKSVEARTQQQKLTMNQKAALTEVMDVLMAVCHAHVLPLALTWVPVIYDGDECVKKTVMLHALESACYVNDQCMLGFMHACTDHQLNEGQGIAGKALQSNHPFFCPDVKVYDTSEYPLAHHARKFGLNAAVAIRLRSTHTAEDDYILELFLPVNCKGSSEQQLLLTNLSDTMQRMCRSLRTVSSVAASYSTREVNDLKGAETGSPLPDASRKYPFKPNECETSKEVVQNKKLGCKGRGYSHQTHHEHTLDARGHLDKKRSSMEKNISLSVLQQYFSGSLKDAAKSIGVCPTTLKRICRQHGISRWPSRKIHKVNRSLKKIQVVIDSVQGVEGALKYDPISGSLVAAVTPSGKLVSGTSAAPTSSVKPVTLLQNTGKLEANDCSLNIHETGSIGEIKLSKAIMDEKGKVCDPPGSYSDQTRFVYLDSRQGTASWGFGSRDAPFGTYLATERTNKMDSGKAGRADEIGSRNNQNAEQNQPSSSGMTDSSNGSESSSTPSMKCLDNNECAGKLGTAITLKATYKEDTVRFKFLPCLGCLKLFEEIGKRFKLVMGTFQLKYMDDEDEWVMLVTDADLQECIEILELIGSRSVKILVRDMPCTLGSSASSNNILVES